jgi:hypothetical protein
MAIIDKMMNCTAGQHQGWFAEVYGDYMDGIASIIFHKGDDLRPVKRIK